MSIRNCPYCRSRIDESDRPKFCSNCGKALGVQQDAFSSDQVYLQLLRAGKKIEAIMRYREKTGADLREAKTAIEDLASRHHIQLPKSSFGSALALFLMIAAIGIALIYYFSL